LLVSKGALCISIDLELAWGIWDQPSAEYHRMCAEKERAIVRSLLQLFSEREIAVTWAVVGRLLVRSKTFPTETVHGDRIWYAPDLFAAIREASPAHDIGSHGFAHLYFPSTPRERLREDLQAARRAHEAHGLPLTSFVFPRDQIAHPDLLAEAGLRVFRGGERGWYGAVRERLGRVPGRVAHFADKLLPLTPPLAQPRSAASGLVELPASMLVLGRYGLRRLVRPGMTELKAKLALRSAARHGSTFHLWFHPSNFYFETDVQLRVLRGILDEATTLRDRSAIEVRTMASYAGTRWPLAGRPPRPTPAVQHAPGSLPAQSDLARRL
jgi:hypothetical protein